MRLIGRRLGFLRIDRVCGDHGQLLTAALHARKSDSNDDRKVARTGHAARDQGHSAFFRRRVEPELDFAVFTYIGQLSTQPRFSLTLGENVSTALKTSVPWTIGSYRCLHDHQLLGGHCLRCVAGLDAWLAARLADSNRDVLSSGSVLLLGDRHAPGFASNPPLVPGPRCVQSEPHTGWALGVRGESAALRRTTGDPIVSEFGRPVWMLGMRNMMITMVAEDFVLMAIAMGLSQAQSNLCGRS